jgi:RNA polymerase-binding transcription factor DksA
MKKKSSLPSRCRRNPSSRPARELGGRWAWHYQTLISLRERLLQQMLLRTSEVTEPIEPHGAHEADSATDEFEHDIALALLAHEENALREVQAAIYRILTGRYGRCELTGRPIPASRLRALPWCRYARAEASKATPAAGSGDLRVPPVSSLRGPRARIPYTGEILPEGHDPDLAAREEPKSGKVAAETTADKEESG